MFGNAPRALWQRWIAPDERNRIPLACRALLIEDEGRRILFETGIGAFFPPKLRDRFGVQEQEHVLLNNLRKLGFAPADIDVVVLSHLHFDHAGGLLSAYDEGSEPSLVFDNASYVVGRDAWRRACSPHARDRASFIESLQPKLEGTGRLEVVDGDRSQTLGDDYRLHFSQGHTPGLMLTEIPSATGPIVFAGDLIPGRPWMHLPITMGYDRFPEKLIEEKEQLLEGLLERSGRVFFTHDPTVAMSVVAKDDRGRFVAGESMEHLEAMELS